MRFLAPEESIQRVVSLGLNAGVHGRPVLPPASHSALRAIWPRSALVGQTVLHVPRRCTDLLMMGETPLGTQTRRLGPVPVEGWVLYDSQCGICSHWVPFWAATLRRIGLDIAPLDAQWVAERTGLTLDVLLTDLRLLHVDGHLTSGADVYRYVMRRRWWAWPFYILSIAPLGYRLFDSGYRMFAAHRRQISSTCRIAPPDVRRR